MLSGLQAHSCADQWGKPQLNWAERPQCGELIQADSNRFKLSQWAFCFVLNGLYFSRTNATQYTKLIWSFPIMLFVRSVICCALGLLVASKIYFIFTICNASLSIHSLPLILIGVVGWSLSQHILARSPIMCVFVCVQACMCITDQASLYISIFQYLWDVVIHSRQSCGKTKHKHEFKAQKGACLFQNSLSSISVVTECLYSKSSVSDVNMKKRYELHNHFMNSWHLKMLPAILCQQCQVCPLCFLRITLWFSHTALCCVYTTNSVTVLACLLQSVNFLTDLQQ